MDAFSLLRYWRSNNGGVSDVTTTSTIDTQTSDSDDNDHGPFFDLEFSLPFNDENSENGNGVVYGEEDEDESDGSDDVEDDDELKFTVVSGSSGGDNSSGNAAADVNVSASPSDDLFFKGSFIPVSSNNNNNSQTTPLEANSKPLQSRVSLVKHATKFRVMMLKLKKSKSSESTEEEVQKKKEGEQVENVDSGSVSGSGKSMTVKFKVAEVPIVSLFKRDNSSKKAQKKRQNDDESITNSSSSDEKKFSKEAMQKYLRKVKPLYVRVSKKYGDKLKSPSLESELRKQLTVTETRKQSPMAESNVEGSEPPLLSSSGKGLIQGNLPAGLRVVCKHLGKSRSASTAVVAAAPATMTSKRRDDSLLQQQDGIQSAILHCKRSFKGSREDSDCSSSLSSDSVATNGKSVAEDKEEMSQR